MTDLVSKVSQHTEELPENGNSNDSVGNLSIHIDETAEEKDAPFIVNAPRINSKLILQNMEEVLNSVKKKHRQKHKRLKEQKKIAAAAAKMEAAQAEAAAEAPSYSKNIAAEHQKDVKKNKQKKYPLQEKASLENDVNHQTTKTSLKNKRSKSPLKNVIKTSNTGTNSTILKHFQRTPKKDQSSLTTATGSTPNNGTPSVKANAFELMMNARNKSIGHNTPGKEIAISPVAREETTSSVNVKRKLMLEEWAELKGGAKRKLEEEAREAYIESQLELRAKRFKQMLVNGRSPSATSTAEKSKKRESLEASETGKESLVKSKSPATNKTECLLGYFQKKETSTPTTTENLSNKTEKRKGRPRRTQDKSKNVENNEQHIETTANLTPSTIENVETPTSLRPKRSCKRTARYDYDLETSPVKNDVIEQNENSNVSVEIIDCEEDSLSTPSSRSTHKRKSKQLAPLFIRSMPKPAPDAEVLKARQEFLRSGVPEKLRQEQVKQKQIEQTYEDAYEYFPKIAHISQQTPEELSRLALIYETPISFTLKPEEIPDIDTSCSLPTQMRGKRKSKSKAQVNIGKYTNCTLADFKAKPTMDVLTPYSPLPTLENKRNIVKSWKTSFEQFPTYKCYNQMRLKYRYFSALDSAQDTEQVSESLVVTRHTRRSLEAQKKLNTEPSDDIKPPAMAPNGELLFTEKYKPLMFEQILVNLAPVTQLRDFLSNWSSVQNSNTAKDSNAVADDTYDFANDSNSSFAATCNSVVLLGPASSGKTNAVYALANELNFSVLEINAGMRRTGKKLIQELQEATQSHQIRKENKAAKQLIKMSYNSKKVTQSPAQSTTDSSLTSDQMTARKCIILIEDADIVFEQFDAGFVDAIYTLSASSKRPVILVASNPNCNHLQRLMQQNTIEFSVPNVLSISKFLSVLSLIENCPIQLDDLISLHLFNRNDLRKTLLELQFFIQSGGDRRGVAKPDKNIKQTGGTAEANVDEQKYFALSSKQQLGSDESNTNADDQLQAQLKIMTNNDNESVVYMHRTLFEFFTINQNEKWRIPFPIDFNLLHVNLSDIMHASVLARDDEEETLSKLRTKRRSGAKSTTITRSPKKEWLNTATTANATTIKSHSAELSTLCDFYDNVSVACLISSRRGNDELDRLKTDMSEYISHNLVEQSLITNLKTGIFPYNLFNTVKSRPSIANSLAAAGVRTKRAQQLDFEPILRDICRSEKQRVSTERRSTRFYHYLRNIVVSNYAGIEHFDNVCDILQSSPADIETHVAAAVDDCKDAPPCL